jgi:hypothetical protein
MAKSRQQEKAYPPNFTEITECRRTKAFSANLGVFGVSRREIFCFFVRFSLLTGYIRFSVTLKIEALAGSPNG